MNLISISLIIKKKERNSITGRNKKPKRHKNLKRQSFWKVMKVCSQEGHTRGWLQFKETPEGHWIRLEKKKKSEVETKGRNVQPTVEHLNKNL